MMKLKDLESNKRYYISGTTNQLMIIPDVGYRVIQANGNIIDAYDDPNLNLNECNFQEEIPLIDNFLDDPIFLKFIHVSRSKYQNSRNIIEQGLPKLKEFAAVVPELFDPFTLTGERNRNYILKALEHEDYGAISIFIQTNKPLYLARKN